MHIPDGYLSPLTCAVLYAAAAPFWYVALKRTKRLLNTRLVPRLAVFAAFSFVIMMFNIPLPGGTTGHATGVGIAAIVLGASGSMLAISAALLIQALLFGDGGVTSFAANSFNMAIVGSLVAALVYRIIARGAALESPRRVAAAAIAGYAAINAAALLTAVELGIQPLFFSSADGVPLYAPYSLNVAIPAMMIGHLTVAGLAETIVTGGVVAYLQRIDLSLLQTTAANQIEQSGDRAISGWRATKRLWLGIAALMIATPLGLLAAGTAWGEWAAEDFNNPETRARIIAASNNHPAPEAAPAGLERLSSLWSAPLPDYAPAFLSSLALGYVLSAIFGTGVIIALFLLVGWLARIFQRESATEVSQPN